MDLHNGILESYIQHQNQLSRMKPNKLLAAQIITSIHARRGRVVKLKSTRYQLDDDMLMKRNFDNHIWQQCIQANAIRYKYFHKNKSLREKDAMPPHFVTIKHLSKLGKLNGVGNIFPYLFDLSKYTLITTIHFIIDNDEASQSVQLIGSELFGVPYYLTLKLNSKHSIDYLLPIIQKIIIKQNKDWHDRVIYQTSLQIFSLSLGYDKKVSFSPNIYLLSLLLAQFSPWQSSSIESQIKDLLKMKSIRIDHVYALDNLSSQINKLMSNWDKVRKTKVKHAQTFCLDPYRKTWKTSLSIFCS